jgi:hypothetical protein
LPRHQLHFLELPSLAAFLDDDKVPVSAAAFTLKRDVIVADIHLFQMRCRSQFVRLQRAIDDYSEVAEMDTSTFAWFKPPVDIDLGTLEREDAANSAILLRPTSIFAFHKGLDPRSPRPFPGNFDNDIPFNLAVMHSYKVQTIARQLAESLEITDLTLPDLDELGAIFQCEACPEGASQPYSWVDLVLNLNPQCKFERLTSVCTPGSTYV